MRLSPSSTWSLIEGGISTPNGFLASGVKAGLKTSKDLDLALLVAPEGAVCAGTFTQSIARAACVNLSAQRLESLAGKARAVLINSGQANACTGERGLVDSLNATNALAKHLSLNPGEVLICSTGVIGVPIQMNNLLKSLGPLVSTLSYEGGSNAAKAILTTDLVTKQIAIETELGGRQVRIGGMAKGSGMIHPDMATMLGYLTCDVGVPHEVWKEMIKKAVDASFNVITVDGDTSTNDAFLAFSAGETLENEYLHSLQLGLTYVAQYLAKAIARDGEGATCLLEVKVEGAQTNQDAIQIARTICGSSLVKTAVHGSDPNWGRIIAAAGRAGVLFKLEDLSLSLGPYLLVQDGVPCSFDQAQVSSHIKSCQSSKDLLSDTVTISLTVGVGSGSGLAWGCDMSEDYIRINADYTT